VSVLRTCLDTVARTGFIGQFDWITGVGYCASLLVFCAFYMKAMIPLRAIAIASNIAFVAYGAGRHLYPILILHAVLLPLNGLRLLQLQRLMRRVREVARSDGCLADFTPLMARQRFKPGQVLFRRGDPARSLFIVLGGSVRVVELGTVFGPGALVGEIGVFAPDGCRTGTVVCEVDAEIGSIDNDTVLRLYSQNPTFGLYLTRLVVQRMLASERRLAEREAPMGSGVTAIIPGLGSRHGHRVPSASPESS